MKKLQELIKRALVLLNMIYFFFKNVFYSFPKKFTFYKRLVPSLKSSKETILTAALRLVSWVYSSLPGLRRIGLDIVLLACTLLLFVLHQYAHLPSPLQLLAFKAMAVSAAIVHSHIARKLLFPKLDWTVTRLTGGHYVAIVFYIVIIYAYAIGG